MSTNFFFKSKKKNCGRKKKKLAEENGKSLKTTFLAQEYAENTFLALKTTYFVNFFPKNQFVPSYMFRHPYISYFNRALNFPPKYFEYFSKFIHKIFFLILKKKFVGEFINRGFFINYKLRFSFWRSAKISYFEI